MPRLSAEVVVGAADGLHLRPAAKLVALAQQFQSQILLTCAELPPADARSMIALATLGAGPGTTVQLTVDGEDAEEALSAFQALFESNFED